MLVPDGIIGPKTRAALAYKAPVETPPETPRRSARRPRQTAPAAAMRQTRRAPATRARAGRARRSWGKKGCCGDTRAPAWRTGTRWTVARRETKQLQEGEQIGVSISTKAASCEIYVRG